MHCILAILSALGLSFKCAQGVQGSISQSLFLPNKLSFAAHNGMLMRNAEAYDGRVDCGATPCGMTYWQLEAEGGLRLCFIARLAVHSEECTDIILLGSEATRPAV